MKKRISALLMSFVMVVTLILAVAIPAASTTLSASADTQAAVPVYRLFNIYTGEHLFTTDQNEYNVLSATHEWNGENIAWYAPASSGTPVHRIFNRITGEHVYTKDTNEVNVHVGEGWWNYEGICWYSDDNHGVTVYRMFNSAEGLGAHHYTMDANEYRVLTTERGWNDEGVCWYALDGSAAASGGNQTEPAAVDQSASTETAENPSTAEVPYWSIEADINLNGSGSGYYAKVMVANISNHVTGVTGATYCPMAAFGLEYAYGYHNAYGGTTDCGYILENIMNNADVSGGDGQHYQWTGGIANTNETHHIKMAWYQSTNTIVCWADGVEVLRDTTTMKVTDGATNFQFVIEGSTCYHGDSINATLSNIVVEVGDSTKDLGTVGSWNPANNYFGLRGTVNNPGTVVSSGRSNTHGSAAYGATITISGTANIPGTDANGTPWNWDTAFGAVEPGTGTTGHPLSAQVLLNQSARA